MVRQIGIFFILVGMFLLIIFGVADDKGQTVNFFCYGGPLTLLGVILWWRNRVVGSPADRFRAYRRWRSKDKG
jgi:hypothetical protein